MATPYSHQTPIRVKCVATCKSQRALTVVSNQNKIETGIYKTTTTCSLTDGDSVYITIKNGSDFEFEEGGSYVVKNYTLSQKYSRLCLFITRATRKFRTAPLAVAESAEKAAKEALFPPSQCMTGEEEDIFSNTRYRCHNLIQSQFTRF
ncbi:hypothetical protein DPX16_0555 [Anabarilius grahami]|uniref:Uncharacterized protein n=1 Tax=Anabarilius grahami TaxID=495550 RepID=A0A3N0XWM6_ANAGA|nr:hypothetical protein DPX16_0555 [Anabarilius grahami]